MLPIFDDERRSMRQPQLRRWLLVIAVIGSALRLAFACLPLSQHLLLLEDDAWMVTAIARNWALGRGITADGMFPTNGFHPLYTLTLGALPYLVAPNNLDAGFTGSLVICAILSSLVMWPFYALVRRLAGPTAALIAVTLYALNPFLIRLTVNGMETSMALLLFVTLLWALYKVDRKRPRDILILAVLTALAILTRLDAVLLFGAIIGALLVWSWRAGRLSEELPLVAMYIVVTLLLLVPYFWRNEVVFGSFSPSSGTALAYMHSYQGQFALSNSLQSFFYNSAIAAEWVPSPIVMVLAIGIGMLAVWRALGSELFRALPLLFYMPLPGLYYGYLMQQSNPRYFVGLSLIIMLFLGWAAARWWERRQSFRRRMILVASCIAIILVNSWSTARFWQQQRTMPQLTQPTSYQAALWIRDNLPADALIGAKNSGIYQYYSGHTVINIDGKLNHEIVPAMEERGLLSYLRAKGVIYLVDREETLADHIQFYSAQFGPAPVHHLPTTMERLKIYGVLVLQTLRLHAPPELDQRDGFMPSRPFSDAVEVVKTFARPNETTNPVVVVRLRATAEDPAGGNH